MASNKIEYLGRQIDEVGGLIQHQVMARLEEVRLARRWNQAKMWTEVFAKEIAESSKPKTYSNLTKADDPSQLTLSMFLSAALHLGKDPSSLLCEIIYDISTDRLRPMPVDSYKIAAKERAMKHENHDC